MTTYSDYSATATATTLAFVTPDRPALRLFLLAPTTVFAARVNLASVTYPLDTLTFDGVTTGAYGDIQPGMTLLLGSSAGADDYGRTRVRAAATATTIPVGRCSRGTRDGELDVVDNAYITVLNDYRVWAKVPSISPNGTLYKDSAIAVGTYTSGDEPPVANAGAPAMGTISLTTGKFRTWLPHVANTSFAVADGATITGYQWTLPSGVALVSGSVATDSAIQVDCDPGFYWIALTVTDSNGNPHTARTWVLARDPDADVCIGNFEITSHRWLRQGQLLSVRVLAAIPATTYPDGTLVAVMDGEPSALPDPTTDRSNVLFWGWHQTDPTEVQATRTGTLAGTVLDCVDVAGRLDSLPGFSLVVYNDAKRDTTANPSITWAYMTSPHVDKLLAYLLHWHSTALELTDWTWSGTTTAFPFTVLECGGESLFDQVNRKCQALMPDRYFVCDRLGRLAVRVDPLLQDAGDRTATVQTTVDVAHWGQLRYTAQRPPRVHWLEGSALLANATTVTALFCKAPGEAPGQGEQGQTHGEQLAPSQAVLNAVTGHRYARLNAPQSTFQITAAGYDYTLVDPAAMTWVNVTLSAAAAGQRGAPFLLARGLVHEMAIRYEHRREGTVRTAELLWERETSGTPAVTVVPAAAEPVDDGNDYWYVPPPAAPPADLVGGVEVVALLSAEGYLFRTADFQTASGSGGPTWDKVDLGTGAIYSWVVDPFSPGYIAGSGTVDGWAVGQDDIWRITDIFGATPAATSVHTFAESATAASYHWRTVQASFGRYFAEGSNPWLLVVSYYGDTAGHAGTWALRSVDGGATWLGETLVSAHYDTALAEALPIGVYTSPKTPGLAYTAACAETSTPAVADGYVSYDWGETWTRLGAAPVDDPNQPLPRFAVMDDDEVIAETALGGSFVYQDTLVVTDDSVLEGPWNIVIAPPAAAVRLRIEGYWQASHTTTNPTWTSGTLTLTDDNSVFQTAPDTDFLFDEPAENEGTNQSFYIEWTKPGAAPDWIGDRDELEAEPPAASTTYCRFETTIGGDAILGETVTLSITLALQVTEIELAGGVTYRPPVATSYLIQPGHGHAGTIHLPWPDNADEDLAYSGYLDRTGSRAAQLMRGQGSLVASAAPNDGSRDYGTLRGPFGARTYDNDRQYAAVAGFGADGGGDQYAAYVSDDAGATWTEIAAPVAAAAAHATEIAFGADSAQVLFLWGSDGYIQYSDDFGATLDDRAGNLATINGGSAPALIVGICGGPTG